METTHKSDWERVKSEPLGGGGQSDVYLVRTPERTKERSRSFDTINSYVNPATDITERRSKVNLQFVNAMREYTRPDLPSELGAMKEFKLRDNEEQSLKRLAREIKVLEESRPGLPRLLGANLEERWMVTEFFSDGTLEDHLPEYKGNAALALRAFRSVVATVAQLHKDNFVHRDIKPANIFIGKEHSLILGDFGLVYVPDRLPRITAYQNETVGAGDFIPPATWRGLGARHENVKPNFDVYMLGKVLWCMVTGKPKLDREYWNEPENDVTKLFPDDPHMHMINVILERSVVEREANCLSSAGDLLLIVNTNLRTIERGGQLLNDGIPRLCHVCGAGHYGRQNHDGNPVYNLRIWRSGEALDIAHFQSEIFVCDNCGHIQFFQPKS